MTTEPAFHCYRAYGLRIHSAFPVPELTATSEEGAPDVVIRFGALPTPPQEIPEEGGAVWQTPDGVYFCWRRHGTFLVSEGSEVVLDRQPGARLETLRLPLLGCVLGVLLHQRGLFTLHASAIAIGGVAVAFIGAKQAGKSTMAAALHRRGHTLIVDDVLALDLPDGKGARAWPGFPQFKLWPASAVALGEDPGTLAPLHPELEKRSLRPERRFQETPLPLHRIYVLREGPVLCGAPLPAREAFVELLTHSYAARFLGEAGAGPEHFRQCQALVGQVPIHRLQRPRDLAQLPEVVRFVEREVGQTA